MNDPYSLERGQAGAKRLEILAEATFGATLKFIESAEPKDSWSCLDAGCGVGVFSVELAKRCRSCLGVDLDPGFVRTAQQRAEESGLKTALFEVGDLSGLSDEQEFDLVFSRYLLSHLTDPAPTLERLFRACKPGGTLLLEDVDFPGHFHHPHCPAFDQYVDLYQKTVSLNGGNPRLGRELLSMATRAGFVDLDIELVVSLHHSGPGKLIAELTMEQIGPSLLKEGLLDREGLDGILLELRRFRELPESQMSIAPTFQLRGRRP
jgi:SAM-dependent methyltransferase